MPKAKPIEDILAELTGKMDILTLSEIIELHKQLVNVSKVADTLKKYIVNALNSGVKTPGYKLVKSRGRANITDNKGAIESLMDYINKKRPDLTFYDVVKVISLEELREKLGEGVVAELLSDFISYESKSFDYAPNTDERPEVTKS